MAGTNRPEKPSPFLFNDNPNHFKSPENSGGQLQTDPSAANAYILGPSAKAPSPRVVLGRGIFSSPKAKEEKISKGFVVKYFILNIPTLTFGTAAPQVGPLTKLQDYVKQVTSGQKKFNLNSPEYHSLLVQALGVSKPHAVHIAKAFQEIAESLNKKDLKDLGIRIEAHTDSRGREDLNQKLSQRRADLIKSLFELNGVESCRITAVGMGEKFPLLPEKGPPSEVMMARAKNRRVEVRVQEQNSCKK